MTGLSGDLRRKLWLLGCLYVAQGIPFGFFSQALPAILRSYGVDLAIIGMVAAFAFPWSLKFLWAPWVDRHGSDRWGHRKSWILPAQVGVILLMIAIAFLDPTVLDLPTLVVLVGVLCVVNLLAATQDVATDGLAVGILRDHERSFGNSIQVSGFRAGIVMGGGGMLMLMGVVGWMPAFFGMAVLIMLVTVPVWFFREPPHPLSREQRVTLRWWPMLVSFVRRPGMLHWLCIIVAFKLGDAFASGMTKPMLVDAGLGLERIGLVYGVVGMAAAMLGALAGGWGVLWLGRRRALLVFGGLQGVSMLGFAWIARDTPGWVAIAAVISVEHFLGGMVAVALYTGMMDACRKSQAGTDFTLQASLYSAATGIAYVGAGFSAEQIGYVLHFALAVVMALLALLPAYFWKEPSVEKNSLLES